MTILSRESAVAEGSAPAAPVEKARRPSLIRRYPVLFVSPLIAILAIAAWFATVEWFDVPRLVLPPPLDVLDELWLMLTGPDLYQNLLVTVTEFGAGFAIGSVSAIVVAAVLVRIPVLERGFSPYIVAFQNFPKIALAPMLITWFGFGPAPKIALSTVLAFFPVFVNVIVGLKSSTKEQRDLMRVLEASEWQTFWMLRVKVALPYIFAGLRIALPIAIVVIVLTEMIGDSRGLGYYIAISGTRFEFANVYAAILVIGACGFVLDRSLLRLRRAIVHWERDAEATR